MTRGSACAPSRRRVVGVDDAHLARLPPRSPMPAYAGMPVSVETPGATSKGSLALASAAASVCSAPSISGSPENRRTTAWPALAASPTILARAACESGRPSSSSAADLGVGDRRTPRQVDDVDVGDDDVGLAQQRGGAQRQQVGVAGADRDERDGAEGFLLGGLVRRSWCASPHGTRPGAPAARRSAAELAPDLLRVAGRAGDRLPHLDRPSMADDRSGQVHEHSSPGTPRRSRGRRQAPSNRPRGRRGGNAPR